MKKCGESCGRVYGVSVEGGVGSVLGEVEGNVGRDVRVWSCVGKSVFGFPILPHTLPHISLHLPLNTNKLPHTPILRSLLTSPLAATHFTTPSQSPHTFTHISSHPPHSPYLPPHPPISPYFPHTPTHFPTFIATLPHISSHHPQHTSTLPRPLHLSPHLPSHLPTPQHTSHTPPHFP